MKKLYFLATLLCIFVCQNALADWGQGGAAYKCDPSANRFAVEATMASSADEQIPSSPGFTDLPQGEKHITCKLKGIPMEATIVIGAPQARGMCGGIGEAEIKEMKIGTVVVIPIAQLGSPCRELRGLVLIEVKIQDRKAVVKQCSGAWDWSPSYLDVKCETAKISNVMAPGNPKDRK